MGGDFDKRNLLADEIRKLSKKAEPAKLAAEKAAREEEKARKEMQEKLDTRAAKKIFLADRDKMIKIITEEANKGEWNAEFEISMKCAFCIKMEKIKKFLLELQNY